MKKVANKFDIPIIYTVLCYINKSDNNKNETIMKYLRIIISPIVALFTFSRRMKEMSKKIESLECRLKEFETKTTNSIENLTEGVSDNIDSTSRNRKSIFDLNSILLKINVSADVCPRAESWAVLSYKTKKGSDIVKFYNLHGRNYVEVERHLEQFRGTNMHIDAPRFFKL